MVVAENLTSLEKRIGYIFDNKNLLSIALTHRSYDKENNERLEYLGDSVLGFIIAEALYQRFKEQDEGVLTRFRANLVNKETLAKLARTLDIGDFIQLGTGEMKSGGWRRDSILSNTLEALIGAIYLDSDISICKTFVLSIYQDLLADLNLKKLNKDPKTELQEFLQARKLELPAYQVIAEEGEAHNCRFTVECQINGIDEKIVAEGRSKRNAEQSVAKLALNILQAPDRLK